MSNSSENVFFTKYTSTSSPLSKEYCLKNNMIEKTAAASMYKGTAECLTIAFEDFGMALSQATKKQAFGYGLHAQKYSDEVGIVVSGKEEPESNILSRTKKFFKYRKEPGVLMLDHDPSIYGPSLTPDEFIEILITIDPKIAKAARVIRGSVSAGVHLIGEEPKNDKGFHVYIPVKDASDIPEYGKLLFDYFWLNGHGYIALSANGGLLVRAPIDAAVFSPERLDFVGKPIIFSEGLKYTQPETTYVPGVHLDTLCLPELTSVEEDKVAVLIAKAKQEIKSASNLKEAEWKSNKITVMQKAGVSLEKATESINKMISGQGQKLYGDFILEFSTKDVLVANVLNNPESFDGKSLADPIEGRAYGKSTAKFWFNDGNPIIHSLAHGQPTSYFLLLKPDWKKDLEEFVEKMNKNHSSVMIGDKHKIMRLEPGSAMHEGREVYVFYNRSELSKVYDNAFIKVGEKITQGNTIDITKNPLMAWALHANSISYSGGVIFLPGKEAPKDYINTWRGFAVEP